MLQIFVLGFVLYFVPSAIVPSAIVLNDIFHCDMEVPPFCTMICTMICPSDTNADTAFVLYTTKIMFS